MTYRKLISSCLVAVLSLAALTLPASAATATPNSGNGLKISPVVTNLTINPGQTQTVTVHVQNVTSAAVTLQVFINDFTATDDESGTPALLLNPNQYAPSHSLKRFVTPINNLTLQAGEARDVKAIVSVPKDAPGGGYYGAVRFAPASASGENNITLSASVGSLILVKVPGTIREDVKLLSLDVHHESSGAQVIFTTSKGLIAAARFQNNGDVQEQPFGKILLKQGTKQIAAYEINDMTPRGNVLPDSIRKFTVNLDKVGAFGKYTVVGNFGYGTNGQLLTGQTTFYVIPIFIIVVVAAVILLILFCVLILPRLVRSYNRRVVQRATHRR